MERDACYQMILDYLDEIEDEKTLQKILIFIIRLLNRKEN